MAVECPAPGCEYEGMVDAVAGHIGGRSDQLHDGMVPTVVRSGEGEGGRGGFPTMAVVLAISVLVLGVVVYSIQSQPVEGEGELGEESAEQQMLAGGA